MADVVSSATLIACLTPSGAGAIATLAVRGPRAWPITRSLFQGQLPETPVPGRFYLGRLGEETNACDEVVLAIKPDWLELHCHGGVEVVRFIQGLFSARGIGVCFCQELISAGASRLHRLGLEQLIYAPTVRAASILLDQVHGALERALAEILGCLQKNNHATAVRLLSRLVQTQRLGRHLVEPFRVVVAGAPNVGKSSLVNALAGFTRSVVSPIPGTTRDVVTTRIALDGWPVELIDTAGLHDSVDALEREGMARTRAILQHADLHLWVLDASAPPLWPPPEIPVSAMIINKIDLTDVCSGELPTQRELRRAFEMLLESCPAYRDSDPRMSIACVSAKNGHGVPNLCQCVGSWLGLEEVLAPGEGLAFTGALADQIVLADEAARAEDWERAGRIVAEIHSSSSVPICSLR
jgi:tRNA modification GTPase